jgi:hypothetical protein
VDFGGVPAASFTESSNTVITAVVPAGASTGPIGITTPAGTFRSTGLFYAPPVITGFSPAFGLPGTNVTLFGTNLLGARSVLFGGVPATALTATNNGFLRVTVPAGARTGPITVVAPGGTNSSPSQFHLGSEAELARLAIRFIPTNQILLSWPAIITNYVLETRTSLTSTSQWSALSNPPAMSGGELTVSDTNTGSARFYRLRK